jgi:hypothetical protein
VKIAISAINKIYRTLAINGIIGFLGFFSPRFYSLPQSRVVSLSLPNTFLNLSSLWPPLATLSSLQLLNLSTCKISGIIPPSYASLRVLDLSPNVLTGDIPDELGPLSGLQFLLLINSNLLIGK